MVDMCLLKVVCSVLSMVGGSGWCVVVGGVG